MRTIEDLFRLQEEVVKAGLAKSSVSPEEHINRALIALTAEVGELIQSCAEKWKWWKGATSTSSDAPSELVDVLLFVILIATLMDICPDEFIDNAYEKLGRLSTARAQSERCQDEPG